MESSYTLMSPDEATELNRPPRPRDRLDTSTEIQVRKEVVLVDMHEIQQDSKTEKDESSTDTSAANGNTRSSELHSVSPEPDSTDTEGAIPDKHTPAVINELRSEARPKPATYHGSNTSRQNLKVSFAPSSKQATSEENNDDNETDLASYQLLDGAAKPSKSQKDFSISASLRNLLPLKKKPPPEKRMLQHLKSRLSLNVLSDNEQELKANLFYHIGNPIKRWRVDKVLPIKLILQLLKTFCLIVQVILFTYSVPHTREEFFFNSREMFESLLLQNFSQQEEARDTYTAYSSQQLFSEFNFINERYFQLPQITIGGYDYPSRDENGNPPPVKFVLRQYAKADFNATFNTYVVNATITQTEFNVSKGENATDLYIQHSTDPLFHRFVDLTVSFHLKNIRIVHSERVECFLFTVLIFFQNVENSGKVNYYLRESHQKEDCHGDLLNSRNNYVVASGALTVLDVGIILMCTISIILTCKTLQRGVKLGKAMGSFYKNKLNIKLSWWERRALFPAWHAVNTFSDVIIIFGTFYKIFLEYDVTLEEDPARVLLGTAIIVQAIVILRYVSYFKQLNALSRTIALALPELLKFLLYAVLLFLAFALTGWIILGPYHSKFLTFNDTVETLFGLLNGDDIYNTFILIDPDDDIIAYAYSRIYLYVFTFLFIYAALNIFTSLVIVAYEASLNYDTATENEVRRFVFSGPLTPDGVALRDVTFTKKYVDPKLVKERKINVKSTKFKETVSSAITDSLLDVS